MRLEIVTKGFERSESVDSYLEGSALQLIETFLEPERDLKFRVTVDEDRHRMQNRKPHYICELVVKPHDSRKILKTQSAGDEFHKTVTEAFSAMKRILAKRAHRFRRAEEYFMAGA